MFICYQNVPRGVTRKHPYCLLTTSLNLCTGEFGKNYFMLVIPTFQSEEIKVTKQKIL